MLRNAAGFPLAKRSRRLDTGKLECYLYIKGKEERLYESGLGGERRMLCHMRIDLGALLCTGSSAGTRLVQR